jgi:hypothetical protein
VITAAELDPQEGNNLAILSLNENGKPLASPRLVVAGDKTDGRDIPNVSALTIGRASPQLVSSEQGCNPPSFKPPVSAPAKGSVLINGAVPHPTALTFAQLQKLP